AACRLVRVEERDVDGSEDRRLPDGQDAAVRAREVRIRNGRAHRRDRIAQYGGRPAHGRAHRQRERQRHGQDRSRSAREQASPAGSRTNRNARRGHSGTGRERKMTSQPAQPYYLPLADEVEVFEAAFRQKLPVLLKGPTGCGKTRFVEYMAWRLLPQGEARPQSLITVACNEDLTGSDLVGRYLVRGDETLWMDGPLTQAVRVGAMCYLDEIVEARKDTMVLIHPLTDHRRILPVDKLAVTLTAHPDFTLVVSYNPGYQSVLKDLKPSTRQRFVTLEFHYPPRDKEAEII